jgi:hypothetical protein
MTDALWWLRLFTIAHTGAKLRRHGLCTTLWTLLDKKPDRIAAIRQGSVIDWHNIAESRCFITSHYLI